MAEGMAAATAEATAAERAEATAVEATAAATAEAHGNLAHSSGLSSRGGMPLPCKPFPFPAHTAKDSVSLPALVCVWECDRRDAVPPRGRGVSAAVPCGCARDEACLVIEVGIWRRARHGILGLGHALTARVELAVDVGSVAALLVRGRGIRGIATDGLIRQVLAS